MGYDADVKELTGLVGAWVMAWGGLLVGLLAIGIGLRWFGVLSASLFGSEYAILIALGLALTVYVAWILLDDGRATARRR